MKKKKCSSAEPPVWYAAAPHTDDGLGVSERTVWLRQQQQQQWQLGKNETSRKGEREREGAQRRSFGFCWLLLEECPHRLATGANGHGLRGRLRSRRLPCSHRTRHTLCVCVCVCVCWGEEREKRKTSKEIQGEAGPDFDSSRAFR